jgi:hypothetical protein
VILGRLTVGCHGVSLADWAQVEIAANPTDFG